MKERLSASPELFPLRFDRALRAINLAPLDEAAYAAASFLDERILVAAGDEIWAPWGEVERAAERLSGESDFIFHIGHVGSTLVSRLLGASNRIFSVREPAALRTLAAARLDEAAGRRLEVLLRLYARVWRSSQRSLLKATSFVSEIGPAMMTRSPSANAILMFVGPQTYMATILAGTASRPELPHVTRNRLERLHRRLAGVFWDVESLSLGEMAALGWTCEICALAGVATAFPERVLWLDFDRFLQRPRAGLTAALGRLHGETRETDLRLMLASPDLRRYAKAPEHAFDADMRRQILDEALRGYRFEIERGLAWINAAASAHPPIAAATRLAAAGRTI